MTHSGIRGLCRTAAALAGALVGLGLWTQPIAAVESLPKELEGVGIEEKLGNQVDPSLTFTDQHGRTVRLGDYFRDGKPVLLTLNYYTCTALCNTQLNGLTESMRRLEWTPGEQFRVVTISINPRETALLAAGKRASYLKSLGRGEVEWHFLVGTERNIRALAEAVGFGYRYDPERDQYAHAAVLTFLSPTGRVARYLYGIDFEPRALKFALMEASEGRIGSAFDQILLTCFHYDASQGTYAASALGIMRLAGIATVVILATILSVLWYRERRRRTKEQRT